MNRICLYFIEQPERDRWILGDRFIRLIVRRIIRGKPKPGGVKKVFINLCKGLDLINQPYVVNLPFSELKLDDKVAILGSGIHCLDGYNQPNKIIAGIGLMTHPSEWPDLCENYPVVKYLQHSEWGNNIYKPYYGDKCELWPVGIETRIWKPDPTIPKVYDFLIYNKIHWENKKMEMELLEPIRCFLNSHKLKYKEIKYGNYQSSTYKEILLSSKAMIFLSEHESQGIAYQEALSTNVPIFAWDQGKLIDPNFKNWGEEKMKTTSVPYFDDRCGMKFKDLTEFQLQFKKFNDKVENNEFAPRDYILEKLTLEICAQKYVDIVNSI